MAEPLRVTVGAQPPPGGEIGPWKAFEGASQGEPAGQPWADFQQAPAPPAGTAEPVQKPTEASQPSAADTFHQIVGAAQQAPEPPRAIAQQPYSTLTPEQSGIIKNAITPSYMQDRPFDPKAVPPVQGKVPLTETPPLDKALNFGMDVLGMIPAPVAKGAAAAGAYYGLRNTEVGNVARKILAPESLGPEAQSAAGAIRREQGLAARGTQQSLAEIEPYHPLINKMDEPSRLNMFNYMEGQPHTPLTPEVKQVADTLRTGFNQRKTELQNISRTASTHFIDDYFPHMWQDPAAARNFLAGREGSGRNLRKREIPTIEEGLKAGLKLKTTNPLEAYSLYIHNMDRFIATEKVFENARGAGEVKYFMPGKQPADWVPLNSRLERNGSGAQAYAPEGWARIYNNFTSRGFADIGPEYGQVYNAARHATNSVTALELALSGYHAWTMTNEAAINEVAGALQAAVRGDPMKAARRLAGSPFAPLVLPYKGHVAEKVYLGKIAGTPEQRELVDILTEAGARMKGKGHAPDFENSAAGSYWTAFKRGALKAQLEADIQRSQTGVGGAVSTVFKNVGRAMDTVMHPLFEVYIPKLKNGAAMENLADWMKAHPGASREETVAAARGIVDSVDNRFGEMIHDNLFWNQYLKQSAMLTLRSYSWTMGAVREVGGGLKDVASQGPKALVGKDTSQRAAYAIALPLTTAAMAAAYQYLKTGEAPKDMQDLMAPRTGGTDMRTGMPERIVPPGFMKDVYGWANHPVQEAYNKMATLPRMAYETARNKNWRDDPIISPGDPERNFAQNVPTWLNDYFNYVLQSIGPITVKNIAKGERQGTNLSTFEQIVGVQPAGMEKTAPEQFNQIMRKMQQRAWKTKERHDKQERERYKSNAETTFGNSE